MAEVADVFGRIDRNKDIAISILTGEGRAFAAGADIKEMQPQTFSDMYVDDFFGLWDRFAACRKPVIDRGQEYSQSEGRRGGQCTGICQYRLSLGEHYSGRLAASRYSDWACGANIPHSGHWRQNYSQFYAQLAWQAGRSDAGAFRAI